jgi:hypothetical protein
MLGAIEETSAFLRAVADDANKIANALARVEEITCAWDDVAIAVQAIQAAALDPNNAGITETLIWAAEALQSFAAQSLELVLNPHNEEEELAKKFARDPELLIRVWTRVGQLRLPRHPLENI